jgi:hypothetical protein
VARCAVELCTAAMTFFYLSDLGGHGFPEVNVMRASQDGHADHHIGQLTGHRVSGEAGFAPTLVASLTKHLGLKLANFLGELGSLGEHEGRMAGGIGGQSLAKPFRLRLGPVAQGTHRQV